MEIHNTNYLHGLLCITGFEKLPKYQGQQRYRCLICDKRTCFARNVPGHLRSKGHQDKLEILNAFNSKSLPQDHQGGAQILVGVKEEISFAKNPPSSPIADDICGPDDGDPGAWGLESDMDDSGASDSGSELSYDLDDWFDGCEDHSEPQASSGQTPANSDRVDIDSSWYPFPNKEVSSDFFSCSSDAQHVVDFLALVHWVK
jgi:hypothetical protein